MKNPMFVLGVGGYTANAVAQAFAEAEGEEGWEVTGTLKSGTTKPKWVSSIVEVSFRLRARAHAHARSLAPRRALIGAPCRPRLLRRRRPRRSAQPSSAHA